MPGQDSGPPAGVLPSNFSSLPGCVAKLPPPHHTDSPNPGRKALRGQKTRCGLTAS